MLKADGNADQARADAGGFFGFGAHFAVGGRPRVGDGGACIAQVGGARKYSPHQSLSKPPLATRHFKRQHHAAAALLLFHQIGLRVIGKARVIHIHHFAADGAATQPLYRHWHIGARCARQVALPPISTQA